MYNSSESGSQFNNDQLENIIGILDAEAQGSGFLARCPAHDDKTPSLSFRCGDRGKLLFYCHAHCEYESIIAAIDIRRRTSNDNSGASKTRTTFYFYNDHSGEKYLRVKRVDYENGRKSFYQEHIAGGFWRLGKGTSDVQPFLHDVWCEGRDAPVYLVEGEKCANALAERGYFATTTPGGANGWKIGYAEAFRGRDVVILPDNDEPGFKYADAALRSLAGIAKSVRVVSLPGLGVGEDVFDFFAYGHSQDEFVEAVLQDRRKVQMTNESLRPQPIRSLSSFLPVLTGEQLMACLPEIVFRWASDIGTRLNRPVEAVAALALCVLGGALGKRVAVRTSEVDKWTTYPCSLWGLVVAPPGSRKTAIQNELLKPVRAHDAKEEQRFLKDFRKNAPGLAIVQRKKKRLMDRIDELMSTDQMVDLTPLETELEKLAEEEEKLKVTRKRYYTSGSTYAKLIELFSENPAGLLIEKDELKGLIESFNSMGNEQTRSLLLEAWSGSGEHVQDTVSAGTRRATSMAATIIGSIQPNPLNNMIRKSDDGFIERFSTAISLRPVPYSDDEHSADENVLLQISELFSAIYSMEFQNSINLVFDDDARLFFKNWDKKNHARMLQPGLPDSVKGLLGKYPTLFCALSGVMTVCEDFDRSIPVTNMRIISLDVAIKVSKWIDLVLFPHAQHIHDRVPQAASTHRMAELILSGKINDGCSLRDIKRSAWSQLCEPDSVELAVEELIRLNWLTVQESSKQNVGRPSPTVKINPLLRSRAPDELLQSY